MDGEKVTITLAVAQWQALLDALGHAPHIIVNSVGPVINEVQQQAGPQIDAIQQQAAASAPPEEPSADTEK